MAVASLKGSLHMANHPTKAPEEEEEEADPVLEARLEHALAPYEDLFPPEDLERFRGMLTSFLTTHPVASHLMDRLRARPMKASSDTVPRRDPAALAEAADRRQAARRKDSG
jgi:hypothetical protein